VIPGTLTNKMWFKANQREVPLGFFGGTGSEGGTALVDEGIGEVIFIGPAK